jgi:TonB family protein
MARWIVTSFALHVAMMAFLYVTAVRWRAKVIRNPNPLAVELAPAPEEEPAPPEPTVATPAPTKATPKPTDPPATKKPTPKKKETPKKEPTKKPTVKPVKTLNTSKLLDILSQKKDRRESVASEPPPPPPPPPPRPTPPQTREKHGSGRQMSLQAKGLDQFRDNYYFTLMSNVFYENWSVPGRPAEDPIRTAVVNVVVLESGTIQVSSCRWVRRSGKPAFDDSVWDCIKNTELPPLPKEFRKSSIEVAVTFQDEA